MALAPPMHRRTLKQQLSMKHWRSIAAAGLTLVLAGSLAVVGAPAASADDIRNREYWLEQSGITKAWEISQGEGVKIAVIDSGIDASHVDLKGAVVGGVDMSGSGDASGTKGVGAEPEHGTLVATMLAGRGHTDPSATPTASGTASGTASATASATAPASPAVGAGLDGVIGVAPKAEILSISVWLGSENPSGKNIDDQIPAAVKWAVDHGAKVINMSLGSTSTAWPQSWDEAFAYAEAKDVVIVAAAGNRTTGSEQVGAPATIPGVLAVGGLDKDGTASVDSSSQGISIGVSAPAEDLAGGLPGGGYARWSGSSGAAPIVAGVAALIRSKYPEMTAAQVINRIISTAVPKGDGVPNAIYGYGILDAAAALSADVPVVESNPLGSISDWIRIHRRGQVTAVPSEGQIASATPLPGPSLQDATAPKALAAAGLSGSGPEVIVLGFLGLVVLILAAGGTHLVLARRRLAAGGTEDGDNSNGSSDPKDGGPEDDDLEDTTAGPGEKSPQRSKSSEPNKPNRPNKPAKPKRTGHLH